MKYLFHIILLTILVLVFFGCNNSTDYEYRVLKGATIYDGTGTSIESGTIVIKKGKIVSIGDEDTPIPGNSQITDLKGKFITPGFVDANKGSMVWSPALSFRHDAIPSALPKPFGLPVTMLMMRIALPSLFKVCPNSAHCIIM